MSPVFSKSLLTSKTETHSNYDNTMNSRLLLVTQILISHSFLTQNLINHFAKNQ